MRRLNEQDGAVSVIVALLLLALLGMGALVLDVGALHWEARQLQNGADAAALAIAYDCAGDDCGVPASTAQQFANANANDGAANVSDLCGRGVTGADACDPVPPSVPAGADYVRVTTRTGSSAGAGLVPPLLGNVIDPTYEGGTIERAATVVWGAVGGGTTIPMAFCEHAWDHYTSSGTNLPTGPITLRTGVPPAHINVDQDCSNPGNLAEGSHQPPGGFGYVQSEDGSCTAAIDSTGRLDVVTGQKPYTGSTPCTSTSFYALLNAAIDDNAPILIPIFDFYYHQGSERYYNIAGFGAFRLTGYKIQGGSERSFVGGNPACPGSSSCLQGSFTEFVSLDGAIDGNAPDYGVVVVRMTD